jgi:hypothetical protein
MVSAGLVPNTRVAYNRLAARYHRSPGDLGEAEARGCICATS